MIHPFELNIRTEKSLCWRFERKMLHFMAMSIHYKIRRNNNTDLKISRIQLQILSIHGKDINTFPMCMLLEKFRPDFSRLGKWRKGNVFMMRRILSAKRSIWWKPTKRTKINFLCSNYFHWIFHCCMRRNVGWFFSFVHIFSSEIPIICGNLSCK